MAQQVYRANLSAAFIPMDVYSAGRTVIIPSSDNNYDKRLDPSSSTVDVGIPQVIYARNVIPTPNGYRGVSGTAYGNAAPGFSVQDDYIETPVGDKIGVKEFAFNRFKLYCTPVSYLKVNGASYEEVRTGPKVLWCHPISYSSSTALPETDSDTDKIFEVVGGECRNPIAASSNPLTYYTRRVKTNLIGSANAWLRSFGLEYSAFDSTKQFISSAVVGLKCYMYAMKVEQDGSVHDTYTAKKVTGKLYEVLETKDAPSGTDMAVGLYKPTLVTRTTNPSDFFQTYSILGICGSSGYLIAYSANTIYWSSLQDPLDFVSSLVTGAGNAVPDGLTSDIHRCIPLTKGFIIYTGAEIISATYTGNSKFPWKFLVVSTTSGVKSNECTDDYISYDNDQAYHLVSCTDGNIRQVTLSNAEVVLPEMVDFINRLGYEYEVNDTKLFTDHDPNFLEESKINLPQGSIKVCEAFNRYVILNNKYIFDKELKRYGRLNVDVDSRFGFMCFSNILLYFTNTRSNTTQQQTLCRLNLGVPSTDSLVILGKFQHARARNLSLQGLEVETMHIDGSLTLTSTDVRIITSLDGQTFNGVITPYEKSNTKFLQSYLSDVEAKNISIALRGRLNLSSVLLTYTLGGSE